MNKNLIQKFLNQACWDQQAQYELEEWLDAEMFAKLIIQECANITDNNLIPNYPITGAIYNGIQSKKILEHFGVEE